jgi:hypothetical protein
LNMFGNISSSPWLDVNVVPSAPRVIAPCSAPAAPASLCISMTSGTAPHRLVCPLAVKSSASSPIGDAGVIG